MIFLAILLIAVIIWIVIKPYVMSYDTVLSFTGGLGSGKSLISTQMSVRLLRKNRWKVFFHNLLHPRRKNTNACALQLNTLARISQRVGIRSHPGTLDT